MKRMDMQTAYAGYGARKVWHKEDRMRLSLPLYSLGEEIFSAVSHGVGACYVIMVLRKESCERRQRQHFRRHNDFALHGLHPLPRIECEPREKGVSRARPLHNLSAHRRHIYAHHAVLH